MILVTCNAETLQEKEIRLIKLESEVATLKSEIQKLKTTTADKQTLNDLMKKANQSYQQNSDILKKW